MIRHEAYSGTPTEDFGPGRQCACDGRCPEINGVTCKVGRRQGDLGRCAGTLGRRMPPQTPGQKVIPLCQPCLGALIRANRNIEALAKEKKGHDAYRTRYHLHGLRGLIDETGVPLKRFAESIGVDRRVVDRAARCVSRASKDSEKLYIKELSKRLGRRVTVAELRGEEMAA